MIDPSLSNTPDRGVLAFHKTPTTSPNVTDGIEAAVRSVLEQSKIDRSSIACLTIGTTHFVNAIVENDARRLSKVAIMRLSKSFTKEIPPFSDFPPALKHIMNGYYCFVSGGQYSRHGFFQSINHKFQVYTSTAQKKHLLWRQKSFNNAKRSNASELKLLSSPASFHPLTSISSRKI